MSCFKFGKSGRNFCPNPVNPDPAGFENFKSGAPLVSDYIHILLLFPFSSQFCYSLLYVQYIEELVVLYS